MSPKQRRLFHNPLRRVQPAPVEASPRATNFPRFRRSSLSRLPQLSKSRFCFNNARSSRALAGRNNPAFEHKRAGGLARVFTTLCSRSPREKGMTLGTACSSNGNYRLMRVKSLCPSASLETGELKVNGGLRVAPCASTGFITRLDLSPFKFNMGGITANRPYINRPSQTHGVTRLTSLCGLPASRLAR